MKQTKVLMAFRLSSESRQVIEECAQRLGVSQAAIVEMAVRKFARVEAELLLDKGSDSGVPVKETSRRLFSQ